MKTLLALAAHPDMAEALRAALNPEKYRVIHRISLEEAEPFSSRGMVDVCVLDVELTTAQGVWVIEKLRRLAPNCPIIAYTAAKEWQWEEEAYLQGVSHVLTKPVRPRMFNVVLERVLNATAAPAAAARSGNYPAPGRVLEEAGVGKVAHSAAATLSVLRTFSGVLTHSLRAEALLRQFLLLLREILGVNRAAVFLRQPSSMLVGTPAIPEKIGRAHV